ncbi:hypothetical protein PspLS_00226 [Pyricularia sp. CBS 133598]|nr:hypothetical protein PspLS_00226 [Pyricularia sp. CBS 133598]
MRFSALLCIYTLANAAAAAAVDPSNGQEGVLAHVIRARGREDLIAPWEHNPDSDDWYHEDDCGESDSSDEEIERQQDGSVAPDRTHTICSLRSGLLLL